MLDAPEGVAIDSETGLIGWTPTDDQQSRQQFLVQVDDGNGNIDTQAFDLFVSGEFSAPSIVSSPSRIATVGEPFEYLVVAEDLDGEVLTYSLESGPAGATIDPLAERKNGDKRKNGDRSSS